MMPHSRSSLSSRSTEQGIARTIAWLEAHPEAQKTDADAATEEILRVWRQALESW
jgi:hypothetical protein